ncbi:MAG: L-aspartate oxidase [Cellulosilyticaceae bacterium]
METAYDAIVVGSGVAGLFCTYHLPKDWKVLVIAKESLFESNSYLAQGGISVARDAADYDGYYEDTLRAGRYQNNPAAVEMMISQSREVVSELIDLGVPFEKEGEAYAYTREGAHSQPRILHYQDVTGRVIMETLYEAISRMPYVVLAPYTTMVDWLVADGRIHGIVAACKGEMITYHAPRVILATGGIGGMFENSTNFSHIRGDSIALALAYSVELKDMNAIQIHPTALYSQKEGRRFLVSEAVRGEGGILLNHKKERFVDELLPRDVVSLAIYEEMAKQHVPYVYLSLAPIGKTRIAKHFPNIAARCAEEGYDVMTEPIPVTPAQHYFMGGIKVDLEGKTSLEGLYAVGETACNGVHGANRLASNSLLESVVFAKQTAKAAMKAAIDGYDEALELKKNYDMTTLETTYKALVFEEIKRKDEKFYEQWCRKNDQCG